MSAPAPPPFYKVSGALTYDDVIRRLRRSFQRLGCAPEGQSETGEVNPSKLPARAVLLIFGKPQCKLFKEEIAADLAHLHHSSAGHLDIFCFGYPDASGDSRDTYPVDESGYSAKAFVQAVNEFKQRTTWKYSGETDLILLRAFLTPSGVVLDLEHAWPVTLEEAVSTGLIRNARRFIQEIIDTAETVDPHDFVSGFSDRKFLQVTGNSFYTWVCKLARLDANDPKRAAATLVRDILRKD